MKIYDVDSEKVKGIRCPRTGNTFEFYAEQDPRYENSVLQGMLTSEVMDVSLIDREPFASSWARYHSEKVEEDEEEFLLLEELVEMYEGDLIALRFNVWSMGCGPSSMNYYMILDGDVDLESMLLPVDDN